MTREEILGKITAPERVDFDFTKDEVLAAMSEFAQQEAIAFAMFLYKAKEYEWEYSPLSGWYSRHEKNPKYCTTTELYQIFKTRNNG